MTPIQRVDKVEKAKQVVGIIGFQGLTKVDVKKTIPASRAEDEANWRVTLRRRHYTLRRKSQAPPLSNSVKTTVSHSPEAEKEVIAWISQLTGDIVPEGTFGCALKNGVILNNIAHAIKPNACPNIQPSSIPYKQMANISLFRTFCLSIGLKDYEVFHVTDLYEGHDIGNYDNY